MNKTNTGHTQKPWMMKKVKTSSGYCFKIGSPEMVEASHGGICLYDDHTSLNPHPRGEQEANADHIIRCVNCHDELLEFIKNVRSLALKSNNPDAACEALAELRGDFCKKLISKAKGSK